MKCKLSFVNVQHGDCIAITVERPQGNFSILIDGGKPKHRAVDKLFNQDLLPKSNGKAQIDLLIASHHDLDHIGGLLDVINDSRFEIKQAWVPVVLKPNFDPAVEIQDETFTQAAMDDPGLALSKALDSMESGLKTIVEADQLEGLAIHGSRYFRATTFHSRPPRGEPEYSPDSVEPRLNEHIDHQILGNFPTVQRLIHAGMKIKGSVGCGIKPLSESLFDERSLQLWADEDDDVPLRLTTRTFKRYTYLEGAPHAFIHRPDRIEHLLMALAATTTRAYYNVTLVAKLINALKAKNIPMHMPLASKTNSIFLDPSTSNRIPMDNAGPFHIELLSPTEELVKKYQEKLVMPPEMLAFSRGINYVTVPNKMSFVFNLRVDKATALLTGDSGFTDFYNGRKRIFDDARVRRIKDVGLVKVPHHGGHFERFARCYQYLIENNHSIKTQFFVTSLGKGHKNPSHEFEHLANVFLCKPNFTSPPEFHFTNPPVRDRFDLICQTCPRENNPGEEVLNYESDDQGNWRRTSPDTCCSDIQPAVHSLRTSEGALDIPDVMRAGLRRRYR